MSPKYTLPPLPYAYDALEPVISQQIMQLHHQKHHQTYITNLNAALDAQATALASNDIPALLSIQQRLTFHGGGHLNHSLFWRNLAPPGSPATDLARSAPTLQRALEQRWGSVEQFTAAFGAVLLGLQGSGWGWLVSVGGPGGRLEIVSTKDQDPVGGGKVPVLGVDMWEHAYYLQYLNNKAGYVEQIWKVIHWGEAEERYTKGVDGAALLKL
ncbi:superoxide dismutase [Mn], mitochondrial [Aspergillus japonicus CBS 114.51]|uniref:Superoxide dismutase n=2 Tax=Aspergillus TaxID=5052 RepID=A0A2V5HNC9_ASPV1|nr:superoxide dismutase [Mn], mitochondrial [Aspergillus japonicus CBS 114.51]PYI23053.1 superoxide dismutase [Mn], mitochondrial [Aspergillus violaceofuscus CBS 115571]RAH80935.1 superoxide dismutase [Mn], mitochondrial [Aspergillus japonicus CBS 114.51]